MKTLKIFKTTLFLLLAQVIFAQTQVTESLIDQYIFYIQDINAHETFLPEKISKTIDINGEKIEHDITYFVRDNKELFSIIIQAYAQPEIKTTYYFRYNKLISVFIEENNFASHHEDKFFRNYFLKEGQVFYQEPDNSAANYSFFINLGQALADSFLQSKK